jgi:hypothetical protein
MPDEVLWNEFISSHRKPIEVTDFSGKVRVFKLSGYLTIGYTIVAKELAERDRGYEFSAFSYSSPHEALSKLGEKIRTALATRNLDPNNFPHLLSHKCTGRIASGGIVVDGEFVSWESFTEMVQAYEGWELEINFGDT